MAASLISPHSAKLIGTRWAGPIGARSDSPMSSLPASLINSHLRTYQPQRRLIAVELKDGSSFNFLSGCVDLSSVGCGGGQLVEASLLRARPGRARLLALDRA